MINCCDYGCDQSPGCPARVTPYVAPPPAPATTQRTCNELGTCQGRTPACPGCTWQLAPGVIDGPYQRHSRWLLALRAVLGPRPVRSLVILGALSAVLGCLVGLLYKAGA